MRRVEPGVCTGQAGPLHRRADGAPGNTQTTVSVSVSDPDPDPDSDPL
jgi:hypothetical protein